MTVWLNATNHVAVVGRITDASAGAVVQEALARLPPPLYMVLDTPGGSVAAGRALIGLVTRLSLICLVVRAHSMGFAILQHCAARWVLPRGTLMQHRMQVSNVNGDLESVIRMMLRMQEVARELDRVMARRAGVSEKWFRLRTRAEWWLTAEAAVEARCADFVVEACCARGARPGVSVARCTPRPAGSRADGYREDLLTLAPCASAPPAAGRAAPLRSP